MSSHRTGSVLDFVVAGAQRAGSTHLCACLDDHPGIWLCPDEVPFFEDPYFGNSEIAELERVFAGAGALQRRGIHRPEYLGKPECAGNLKQTVPDVRVIAVLREPVARAVSAYYWYMQFGLLPVAPAEAGLTSLLDGWTDPAYPRAPDVIGYGFYAVRLRRYLEEFGHDRVKVIRTEDLTDPSTFRDLYGFLSVDPEHVPSELGRSRNDGTYDLRRLRWLRTRRAFAFSWASTDRYTYRPRRLRKPAGSLVAAGVVAVDRVVLSRVFREGQPELSAGLRNRLWETYAADLTQLAGMVDLDVTSWRRRPG